MSQQILGTRFDLSCPFRWTALLKHDRCRRLGRCGGSANDLLHHPNFARNFLRIFGTANPHRIAAVSDKNMLHNNLSKL